MSRKFRTKLFFISVRENVGEAAVEETSAMPRSVMTGKKFFSKMVPPIRVNLGLKSTRSCFSTVNFALTDGVTAKVALILGFT